MNNLITVLMGVYNCENTVREALDSLLNQTVDCWKCVICDDGSTDDTYSVVKEYEVNYPDKFFVIKNDENKGLNIALNRCLEYADTPYIARMDGDDISLDNRFEIELDFLENHLEYDIVGTAMIFFDDNGVYNIRKALYKTPTLRDVIVRSCIHHGASMMRTDSIKSIGGYGETSSVRRIEDADLWIRMYQNGSKCYNLDEALYKYRHDSSKIKCEFSYMLNVTKMRLNAARKAELGLSDRLICLRSLILGLLPTPIYRLLHYTKNYRRNKYDKC